MADDSLLAEIEARRARYDGVQRPYGGGPIGFPFSSVRDMNALLDFVQQDVARLIEMLRARDAE